MKAVFLVQKGSSKKAFDIRDTKKPSPGVDEVLIKVECFGLNYADIMARNGLYREAPPMPCILGYEVVGRVEEVGKNVKEHWIGKRVVGFTRFGGYAEFATTPSEAIVEIGDFDGGQACCIATQYVTAWYMARELNNLHPGDKVLIHAGAGGVGLALIQLCKLKNCEVFATVGSDEKKEFLLSQGVDHVINYKNENYFETVKKILRGERLDVTFNPIAGSTYKKDFNLIGSGGRVILFGGSERSGKKWGILSSLNFVRKMGLIIPIGLMMRSKSIHGVNMLKIGDNKPQIITRCLNAVTQEVLSGQLKPYVGATYKVDQIADAHEFLESRASVGKVVVYWG